MEMDAYNPLPIRPCKSQGTAEQMMQRFFPNHSGDISRGQNHSESVQCLSFSNRIYNKIPDRDWFESLLVSPVKPTINSLKG